MKSLRARIALSTLLAIAAVSQTACSSGGSSTANAASDQPVVHARGLMAQADPVARNVIIQMDVPGLASVPSDE